MNQNTTDHAKTAALYIRVSTEKQEELSPESQKDKLLEYALQNGYYVPAEYIFWEIGISGRKADKRPEFQRMIGIAKDKSHPFDAILVWKFSRFARNQEESIVYKSMLKKDNVDVISVSEYICEDVFGKLIERIIEWMDEYYSIRLSGDVFRGMHKKAELGGYQASPPLGYKIAVKGEPPIIDAANAEIVKSIFRMYVEERMSIYSIAARLNELGLTTKSGKPFQKRSVAYMLNNIHYCGYIRWNVTNNTTKQRKDETEWIVTKGNFEPIISEKIYNAAKERLQNEHPPRKSKPVYQQKHWLSGMVKCSSCGRSLTIGSVTKGSPEKKYFYLQCYGYQKGLCNVSHHVSLLKIESVILDAIKTTYKVENFEYEMVNKKPESTLYQELLLSQLKKLEEKEARSKQAYLEGVDSLNEYKETKLLLQTERNRLSSMKNEMSSIEMGGVEMNGSDKQKDLNKISQEQIKDVYSVLTSETFSNDEKANALRKIIHKIVFQKNRNQIDLYFLYDDR